MDGSEQSSSSVPISSPSKKASLPAGLKFKRRERTMEQISDDEAEGRPSRKGESEKIGNQEGSGNGNSHVTKKSKAEKRASSPPKKNAEKEKVDKGDKELKKSASQPLSALAARKEREKEEALAAAALASTLSLAPLGSSQGPKIIAVPRRSSYDGKPPTPTSTSASPSQANRPQASATTPTSIVPPKAQHSIFVSGRQPRPRPPAPAREPSQTSVTFPETAVGQTIPTSPLSTQHALASPVPSWNPMQGQPSIPGVSAQTPLMPIPGIPPTLSGMMVPPSSFLGAPPGLMPPPGFPTPPPGFPTPPPGFPTPPPGFLGGSMGYPLPPPPGMPLPPAPTDGYPARHTPSQRPPPSVMSYEPSAPVEYTPTTGTQVRAKTADEKRVFWESRVRRGVVREDPSSFPHEPPFSSTETTPKQHVVSYRQWTSSDDAELEASLSKNGVPSRGSGPRVDGWYYSALATWDEVAADVPGRTAMECRFRFMTKTRWKGVGGQGAEESNVVESPKPEE